MSPDTQNGPSGTVQQPHPHRLRWRARGKKEMEQGWLLPSLSYTEVGITEVKSDDFS